MTRRQINISVLAGMAVLIAGMMLHDKLLKGRSMPHTASECRSVDVPCPDIDRPSTLAIREGSYDEQGKDLAIMGRVLPAKQRRRLGNRGQDSSYATRGQSRTAISHATGAKSSCKPDDYMGTLDYFWSRESSKGTDPRCRVTGPAGEEGEYQITPIFAAEVERISGYVIDVFDNESCRYGIRIWLKYWAPRVFKGKPTIGELYGMYRLGPKGYREWRSNDT